MPTQLPGHSRAEPETDWPQQGPKEPLQGLFSTLGLLRQKTKKVLLSSWWNSSFQGLEGCSVLIFSAGLITPREWDFFLNVPAWEWWGGGDFENSFKKEYCTPLPGLPLCPFILETVAGEKERRGHRCLKNFISGQRWPCTYGLPSYLDSAPAWSFHCS